VLIILDEGLMPDQVVENHGKDDFFLDQYDAMSLLCHPYISQFVG